MRLNRKFLSGLLVVVLCLSLASCRLFSLFAAEEQTTAPESTTPEIPFEVTTPEAEQTTPGEEQTTPEVITPTVTEPDFPNTPDPEGTKRY